MSTETKTSLWSRQSWQRESVIQRASRLNQHTAIDTLYDIAEMVMNCLTKSSEQAVDIQNEHRRVLEDINVVKSQFKKKPVFLNVPKLELLAIRDALKEVKWAVSAYNRNRVNCSLDNGPHEYKVNKLRKAVERMATSLATVHMLIKSYQNEYSNLVNFQKRLLLKHCATKPVKTNQVVNA